MYKYKDVINILINNFSVMKEIFESDKEYYEDLPYVFFESEFVKYIVECFNNNEMKILKRAFLIIEDLMEKGDKKVVNLIEVAVIESIYFEQRIIDKKKLERYFGDLTMKSYLKCSNQ